MSENKADATFELDISVLDNTIIVGENGGNVTGGGGDTVIWLACDDVPHFTLQFFRLAAEPKTNSESKPVRVAELSSWPFSDPPAPPPSGIVGPTRFFRGTLASNIPIASAFKYTVTVGNLQLDPIVIFDR